MPTVTVTADRLAAMLSEATGQSLEFCRDFVKEFFEEAADIIAAKGNLTVNGLGKFSIDRDVTPHTVFFEPDKAATDVVNAPFAAFMPIDLLAGELEYDEPAVEPQVEEPAKEPATEEPVAQTTVEESTEQPASDGQQVQIDLTDETEQPVEPEREIEQSEQTAEIVELTEPVEQPTEQINEPVVESDDELVEPDEPAQPDEPEEPAEWPTEPVEPTVAATRPVSRCKSAVWAAAMFALGIILGGMCGYFFYHKINAFFHAPMSNNVTVVWTGDNDTVKVEKRTAAPVATPDTSATTAPDTAVTEQPKPSGPVVAKEPAKTEQAVTKEPAKPAARPRRFDRVTKTVYLATLARRYYGQGDYWVYIYDANRQRANLRHPDRIAPGTELIIPYADELPLTGNLDDDIRNARRHGQDIYARYR